MISNWAQLLALGIVVVNVTSLPTGLVKEIIDTDQPMRPKAKRAQEVLMFGNQQNRRTDNAATNVFVPPAEKRTLGTSGLEDVKAALAEDETFGHGKQPIFNHQRLPNYGKNYESYGKVMMNEIGDDLPRNWDMPPYRRYLAMDEDRRKRSESKIGVATSGPPSRPTTASPSTVASPMPIVPSSPRPLAQSKRSLPLYQEPRYKRALDREDLLALLSLWENGARAGNCKCSDNDEYENFDDDGNLVSLDDEDPRAGGIDGSLYTPRHFSLGPELSPSDIGIPRTHPINSYEQYAGQYAPAYENIPYEAAQYRALYPHNSYYPPPEKRFMVSRKRSQGYDTYSGRNINDIVNFSQMMNSQPQGYPTFTQRLLY